MKTIVFCTDVSDYTEEKYSILLSKVSDDRKKKAERYKNMSDRYLSVAAATLINIGFDYLDIPKNKREIHIDDNYKPGIDYPGVYFSVSHSGSRALVAFSDREVGCDIEYIKDSSYVNIASRFFAPSEFGYIDAIADDIVKKNTFYRFWTAKEAVMKLTGLGMKLPTDSFEIGILSNKMYIKTAPGCLKETVYFKEYAEYSDYAVTVVAKNNEFAAIEEKKI